MADGSIRISTKLDSKPAKADLEKFVQEFQKAEKKIEEAGAKIKTVFTGMSKGQLNSTLKTANRELEKTEKALAAVESKIAEMQAQTDKMLPQAETDDQAANLIAMEEAQTAPLLRQREELTAKAAEYKQQMEAITAELNKQTQAEAAQNALKSSGKEAAADAEWLGKIRTQEQYNAALDTTRAKMAAIERQAEEIARETGASKDKLLQQDKEYQKLSRRLSLLTSQTKKFGDAGAQAGKKTKTEMSKAQKSINGIGTALKQGIKKVGKMALAVLGIRAAYNAVRRAADAYLQGNQALQQQLSSIWNIIGQAIGPVIEMMVKGISTVIMWVSSLIKALTGVDLVAKANAAALKKQAGATKEAAKAAQLAGFDEMNKLNDDSSSGGGGGGSAETFDPSLAFDIPGFMKKMKEQILSGDWFGAGDTLGETFIKWIEDTNWASVGAKLGEILGNVVGFALGFITNLDPFTIHRAVTGLIGGLFKGLAEAIQGWDWNQIGAYIVDALIFALLASNPVALIIYTLLTPEGEELASGIFSFIGSLIGGIAQAVVGAAERIWEIGGQIFTGIKEGLSQYIDWEGTPGEIIAGLWEGIKAAISGVGEWIVKNIWEPFKEGFCKAFGIESPSKKMIELARYIVLGFVEGVKNIWEASKKFFVETWTGIKNVFASVKSWFSGVFSGAWTAIKNCFSGVGSFFSGIWNTIKSKFTTIGSSIGDAIGGAFKKVVNSIIKFAENTINGFIKAINAAISLINNIPGVNIKKLTLLSIPKLAKGGIVNNPGRGVPVIAGEAGAEAVLPLENNTGWMDILAEKINGGAGKIIVPIYLNGRKIAEEIIDLSNKRKFATNGAF